VAVTIREATVADRDAIVALALAQFAESIYGRLMGAIDPVLVGLHVDLGMSHGMVLVAVEGDVVVGFIGVVAHAHPLNGEGFMRELAWTVAPAHRRGRVGPALLAEVENWGKRSGLSMIEMSAPEGSTVGRFYKLCGYDPVETAYFKRL
jgi:GNAT superfamily N-acetyltransferase